MMATDERPIITKVADLLVAAGWDEPSARDYAPRMVVKLRQVAKPCPCGGRREPCRLNRQDGRHGTETGWKHGGCVCVPCRKAHADFIADWRARRAS